MIYNHSILIKEKLFHIPIICSQHGQALYKLKKKVKPKRQEKISCISRMNSPVSTVSRERKKVAKIILQNIQLFKWFKIQVGRKSGVWGNLLELCSTCMIKTWYLAWILHLWRSLITEGSVKYQWKCGNWPSEELLPFGPLWKSNSWDKGILNVWDCPLRKNFFPKSHLIFYGGRVINTSYALKDCKPLLSYLHLELYLCKSSEIQLRTLLLVLNKNKVHFYFVFLLIC